MDASDSSSFHGVALALGVALAVLPTAAMAYTVNPGTWSPTGSMSVARSGHTATRLRNGKVLIVGGCQSAASDTAELYDPATGQFAHAANPNHPRCAHTATLLRDGRVLIDGGLDRYAPSEIYDPSTGAFTDTGHPLPIDGSDTTNRQYGNSALLPDGRVLIAFGLDIVTNVLAQGPQTYDPATGQYSNATGSATCQTKDSSYGGLDGVASATLNNGEVLFAGGNNNTDGFGASAACAEIFDPSTNILSNANPMTTDRQLPSATIIGDGRVLVAGGESFCFPDCATTTYHGSAEIYDPRTDTFTATGAMADSRYSHTGTLLPNGEVLVAGGANSGAVALPWAELYNLPAATFGQTGTMPSARYGHTATLLPNGMTLVTGGLDSSGNAYATAAVYAPPNPVNIGAPVQGDVVFGNSVKIQAEYAHPNPVQWVDVYVDGTLLGASPPQTFTWDASKVVNGPHVISAKAFNSGGSVVGTSAVTVNVANGPVALFWPKEDATVSHTVAIAATKGPGVQWIDFYIDGKFLKATPPNTIYWDSSTVANGSHTLSAKGFNNSGQTVGTDSVVVNVLN